jgi:hypothetical protein
MTTPIVYTMNIEDVKPGAIIDVKSFKASKEDHGLYLVVGMEENVHIVDDYIDEYVTHAICYHFDSNSTIGIHPLFFAKCGVLVAES